MAITRWDMAVPLLLSAIPGAVSARQAVPAEASPGSASTRVIADFAACRGITEPTQRLACFDKASAALETAVATKEVRIVDKADVRKARRSLFGFSLPRVALLGTETPGKDEPEFTEINSTIKAIRPIASSRVEIVLADDGAAVWQTTDPVTFPPRAGSPIRIRKGALGNYFLAMGGRSYRGSRVR